LIEIKTLASSSAGNAHLITDGVTPLLIECGISFSELRRRLGFTVSGLAGCLVSHEHGDHAKAVVDLMKAGVDIYTAAGTIKALGLAGHRVTPVRAREQFSLGRWTILPFEAQHDAAEPLCFLTANRAGDKLLYATDTYYIRYRFRGLTHIMVEANYAEDILRANVDSGAVPAEMKKRIIKSHMSLETVKNFLKANDLSQVREIWLLHLSNGNSDAKRFKREVQELTGKPVVIAEK
jgi:phosphoribosyl 1,2-cyclic phosphodiesterase